MRARPPMQSRRSPRRLRAIGISSVRPIHRSSEDGQESKSRHGVAATPGADAAGGIRRKSLLPAAPPESCALRLQRVQQIPEEVRIERFDEMMVKSRLGRAATIFLLAPP